MDLETMWKVSALRTVITVDSAHESRARVHAAVAIQSLKNHAAANLQAAAETYGVDIHPSEVVVEPLPVGDAPAPGLVSYRARWFPEMGSVELRGGPKDGLVIALRCWRDQIDFRVLAPGWQDVIAAGGSLREPLPKLLYSYRLAGYDEHARRYFFALAD